MAEMELFIKPIFTKESVDKFAGDVEKKIGGGGSGSGGANNAMKEQKKQTGLLETLGKFAKITAAASMLTTAATLLPGAFNVGQSLGDTRDQRLERAFRGGENFSEDIADQIENGEELNDVLTEQMVVQEALDQIKRKATATTEGDTRASEDAAQTIDDLKAVYVELGGTLEDFEERVATLAAQAWVDGEVTKEQIDIIDDAFEGTKDKIGDASEKVGDFAGDIQTKTQQIDNNIENFVGKSLDDVSIRLETLPSMFKHTPLIEKFQGVVNVLVEINDLLTDIDNFDFGKLLKGVASTSTLGRTAMSIIDSKRSGDGLS